MFISFTIYIQENAYNDIHALLLYPHEEKKL